MLGLTLLWCDIDCVSSDRRKIQYRPMRADTGRRAVSEADGSRMLPREAPLPPYFQSQSTSLKALSAGLSPEVVPDWFCLVRTKSHIKRRASRRPSLLIVQFPSNLAGTNRSASSAQAASLIVGMRVVYGNNFDQSLPVRIPPPLCTAFMRVIWWRNFLSCDRPTGRGALKW